MKLQAVLSQILILSLLAQPAYAQALPVHYENIKNLASALHGYIKTIRHGADRGGQKYSMAIHYCIGAEGPDSKELFSFAGKKMKALKPLITSLNNSERDLIEYDKVLAEVNKSTTDLETASKAIDTSGANIDTGAFCKLGNKLDEYKKLADEQAAKIENRVLLVLRADLGKKDNIKKQKELEDTLKQYPKCADFRNTIIYARQDTEKYLAAIVKYKEELQARSLAMSQAKQSFAKLDCSAPVVKAEEPAPATETEAAATADAGDGNPKADPIIPAQEELKPGKEPDELTIATSSGLNPETILNEAATDPAPEVVNGDPMVAEALPEVPLADEVTRDVAQVPPPEQKTRGAGWGTALAIGAGVAVLGVGAYLLSSSSKDKNEDKKDESNTSAEQSGSPESEDTISINPNQGLIDAVNSAAENAKTELAEAKSQQEFQDIASGFANHVSNKLSAAGISTQVEMITSSAGFNRSALKLTGAESQEAKATAAALFNSESLYDPLAGIEPSP